MASIWEIRRLDYGKPGTTFVAEWPAPRAATALRDWADTTLGEGAWVETSHASGLPGDSGLIRARHIDGPWFVAVTPRAMDRSVSAV